MGLKGFFISYIFYSFCLLRHCSFGMLCAIYVAIIFSFFPPFCAWSVHMVQCMPSLHSFLHFF